MKRFSSLWLLPLVVALFIGLPSVLFAGGGKDKAAVTTPAPAIPETIQPQPQLETAPVVGESPQSQPEKALPVSEPLPPQLVTAPPVVEVTSDSTPEAVVPDVYAVGALGAYPTFVPPAPREALPGDTAIPKWVLDPDAEEQKTWVIGIGSAKSSSDQLSIQVAEARARQDISFQLDTQIRAQITDYAQNEGNIEEYNLSQAAVTERIGQQLTNIELKGVRVATRERAHDGTWWVKVLWSKASADKAAADITETVIQAPPPTPVAGPAERAQDAVRLMDEQLDKAILRPAPVSE
jgi:hypothetical protein